MTTIVIGGGLAGAFAARALDLAGEEVMLVEAAIVPGGVARQAQVDGYHLEPAAGTVLLPNSHLSPLLEGLDLDIRPAGHSARRLVRHGGRTIDLIPGPGLVTSGLLSVTGWMRLLAEPLIGKGAGDETLEDFLTRRVGVEAGRLAAGLMAAGVHAGDPRRLTAVDAAPALVSMEDAYGSLLKAMIASRRMAGGQRPRSHVVVGGTARIAEAVAGSLGERWLAGWTVEHLEQVGEGWRVHGPTTLRADRVVAAVRPAELAGLYPLASVEWDRADSSPVAVVFLGLGSALLDAIGVLVGPDEAMATLGVLFESSYAPDRAPPGLSLAKAIVGGATNPTVVDLEDQRLIETVVEELTVILGSAPTVDFAHVIRHRPGIPQYTYARRRGIAALRQSLPPGLVTAGWGYDGAGVTQLAAAATTLTTGQPTNSNVTSTT